MAAVKPKDKGKPTPMVDRNRATDINMTVLKRIDDETEEILATAGHVCLYHMSVDDQQWKRKGIEGSLFLVKRRTQPRFQMVVLNKLSTNNYMETIHGGLELEVNPPYLMYTHGNEEIHGVWFYEKDDLERMGSLLKRILSQLPKPDSGAAKAAADASAPNAEPQPAPAAAPPPPPVAGSSSGGSATGSSGGGGDDAFWDKQVSVTEGQVSLTGQQLAPAHALLTPDLTLAALHWAPAPAATVVALASAPSGAAVAAPMGLHDLLRQAQQKHQEAGQQQTQQQQVPPPRQPTTPVSNSSSVSPLNALNAVAGAAVAAVPAAVSLLTPSFFKAAGLQQPTQPPPQQQRIPPAAAIARVERQQEVPKPVAAAVPAPPPLLNPLANGTVMVTGAAGAGSTLHQLLARAAKQSTAAAPLAAPPAASPMQPVQQQQQQQQQQYGARAAPLPAARQQQQQQQDEAEEARRARLRQALGRLVQKDEFLDLLLAELQAVGLCKP